MKTYDPKDEITLQQLQIVRDPWESPSRCKRPPLKKPTPPSLLAKLLAFLGLR